MCPCKVLLRGLDPVCHTTLGHIVARANIKVALSVLRLIFANIFQPYTLKWALVHKETVLKAGRPHHLAKGAKSSSAILPTISKQHIKGGGNQSDRNVQKPLLHCLDICEEQVHRIQEMVRFEAHPKQGLQMRFRIRETVLTIHAFHHGHMKTAEVMAEQLRN